MDRAESISLMVAAGVTLVAAATDLRHFKVYNVLTLPALAVGVVASPWLVGLGESLAGVAVGFGVLVAFFALGGVGAGDVKLFAALGAWLGPRLTAEVFLASALAAGVYALVLAAIEGGITLAWLRVADLGRRMVQPAAWSRPSTTIGEEARRPGRRRRLVPFAVMTCLGFFAVVGHRHAIADPLPRADNGAGATVSARGEARP